MKQIFTSLFFLISIVIYSQNWVYYSYPANLPSVYINSITSDKSGNVWIGSHGGVTKFDGNNWTTYTNDGLGNNEVRDLVFDSNNNLWVATWFGGVYKYNGTNWISYNTSNGLLSNNVYQIVVDNENNIWIAMYGGLQKYDGTIWTSYTTNNVLPNNDVQCIAIDKQGNLWAGTEGSGVAMFNGTNWVYYTESNGLGSNTIEKIIIDNQNNKWFGTISGFTKYDNTNWTYYNETNGLPNNDGQAINVDNDGKVWFGTEGGITILENGSFTTYNSSNGLSHDYVNDIYFVNKDAWLATNNGISVLSNVVSTSIFNEEANYFEVYPNPINDVLYIKGFNNNPIQIKIFNMSGQLVDYRIINSDDLNLCNLLSGVYILKISDGNSNYQTKIIKN